MKSLLLFLLCSFSMSYGQTSRTIYFNNAGKVTAAAKASYYCVITRNKNDTVLYTIESFYASKNRMNIGSYRALRFPVKWEKLFVSDFTDAFREGMHREYHPGGQVRFQGDFRRGRGEGSHRRLYENGQLLSETTLVNGQEEGLVTDYYENGQIEMRFSCVNGLPEGELTEYYETGKKKSTAFMKAGVRIGKIVRYDDREQPLPD